MNSTNYSIYIVQSSRRSSNVVVSTDAVYSLYYSATFPLYHVNFCCVNVQVRAVRPDETDRAEALLQVRGASVAVDSHFNVCSMAEQAEQDSVSFNIPKSSCLYPNPSTLQSVLPEEDTFLAQVNTRAKVTIMMAPFTCG